MMELINHRIQKHSECQVQHKQFKSIQKVSGKIQTTETSDYNEYKKQTINNIKEFSVALLLQEVPPCRNNQNQSQKYTYFQVEQTAIVKNHQHVYFIAKKIEINDQKALHQIIMYKNLKHPNIIRMEECFIEGESLFIIEQYCEEGDLAFHIRRQIRKKKTYFQESILASWLLQAALALEYLHNCKIIHRDIKPQNIFLTSSGNVKLGSFKLAKTLDQQISCAETMISSPYYMAPELLENQGYDFKIDVWAFGCLFFQLANLRPPYSASNIIQMANKISKNKIEDLPVQYSKQFNMIYHRCMRTKPHERPSAKDLLKSSYFLDKMKDFITQKGLAYQNGKIPIKKYKVHSKNIEKIRTRKVSRDKVTPKIQPKTQKIDRKQSKSRQKPRIFEKRAFTPTRNKSSNKLSQEQIRAQSRQNKRVLIIKSTAQVPKPASQQQRANSRQREVSKQKKKQQNIKFPLLPQIPQARNSGSQKLSLLLPPPSLQTQKKHISQQMKRNSFQNRENGENRKNGENKIQSSSKERNKTEYRAQSQATQQCLTKVRQNLSKVFQELKIRDDDEQQFSFELQGESDVRLTKSQMQRMDGNQMMTMYNSKLQELIHQINYKYCPDMQCIQQRTNEFDSNEFAKNRRVFDDSTLFTE